MDIPEDEAATRPVSIADPDRRPVVHLFADWGCTARGSARRREPAVKVRLVDRDLPTGQGKIYPNWPRTTQLPHQTEPYGGLKMEASRSVSPTPTRPGKLDPSVHCSAAIYGCASEPARDRRMAASYLSQ